MAIKCIMNNKGKDLTFGEVEIGQFFADMDNDLMFKVNEFQAFYFRTNEIIRFFSDERILRIIEDLEIKEL